jgi:hypothetical protein
MKLVLVVEVKFFSEENALVVTAKKKNVSERLGYSLLEAFATSGNKDGETEYGLRLLESRICQ